MDVLLINYSLGLFRQFTDVFPTVGLIIHGDAGTGIHDLGSNAMAAAYTHQRELEAGVFWQSPLRKDQPIEVVHASNVSDILYHSVGKRIAYLAYFGHGNNQSLYIGEESTSGTNLSNLGEPNDTPVSVLPRSAFTEDAMLRIFSCWGGWGTNPIAQQIASHLGRDVYAWTNGLSFQQIRRLDILTVCRNRLIGTGRSALLIHLRKICGVCQ
jgi:hypothetical protein